MSDDGNDGMRALARHVASAAIRDAPAGDADALREVALRVLEGPGRMAESLGREIAGAVVSEISLRRIFREPDPK